jgi:ATP-dependent exoDNAse (exonuclease V) beta subunit
LIILAFRYLADTSVPYYLDLLKWEMKLQSNSQLKDLEDLDHNCIKEFESGLEKLRNLDLLEATDEVVRIFKPDLNQNKQDLPYLFQFRDQVKSFILTEGGNFHGFLEWWDMTGSKQMLVTEGNTGAMRIMTIHKAKGLSSPVVIIPYCNWELDHPPGKGPWLWVDTGGTPFGCVPLIPVRYGAGLKGTRFRESYYNEKAEAAIDSLNLLYVAFTRPVEVLVAFCPCGNRTNTVADALFACLEDIKDTGKLPRVDQGLKCQTAQENDAKVQLDLKSYGFNKNLEKLVPAETFESESIRFGTLIHSVLESLRSMEDPDHVVGQLIASGEIDETEADRIRELIGRISLIPEIREWFDGSWEIMTEPVILVPGSSDKRPDRVMIRNNQAVVLDYKTGSRERRHHQQVAEYMDLVKEMGYDPVRGYLLYLDEPALVEVRSREGSFQPARLDPKA